MTGLTTRLARRPVAMAIAALAVLTTFGPRLASATAAPARVSARLVPSSGALIGAWVDPDGRWIDNQSAEGEVSSFEKQIGRKLDLDSHYYGWTDKFPSGLEQWDLQSGRTPIISWKAGDLDSIVSGSQDGLIRQRADDVKALGKPVFLRFAWEMNGNWYPWSGAPAKYVAAWRHVHDVFDNQGAGNVVWVWSPNNQSVPNTAANVIDNYYPGDRYAALLGLLQAVRTLEADHGGRVGDGVCGRQQARVDPERRRRHEEPVPGHRRVRVLRRADRLAARR